MILRKHQLHAQTHPFFLPQSHKHETCLGNKHHYDTVCPHTIFKMSFTNPKGLWETVKDTEKCSNDAQWRTTKQHSSTSNHLINEVAKDVLIATSPSPVPKHRVTSLPGYPGVVEFCFDCFHRLRVYSLSGHLVLVFDHPHSKKSGFLFSGVTSWFLIHAHYLLSSWWAQLRRIWLLLHSHQVFIHITKLPREPCVPDTTVQAVSASPCMQDITVPQASLWLCTRAVLGSLYPSCTGEPWAGPSTPDVVPAVLSRGEGSTPTPDCNTLPNTAQDAVVLLCHECALQHRTNERHNVRQINQETNHEWFG